MIQNLVTVDESGLLRAWRMAMADRTLGFLRGAMAGLAATGAMTAVMVACRRAGLLGEFPPRIITRRALAAAGARPSRARTNIATAVAHVSFGVMAGGAYAALAPRRQRRLASVAQGAGYGALVWAVSYAGWVPALGVMAPPDRDRRFRPASMVLAHVVYGATLGGLMDLRSR